VSHVLQRPTSPPGQSVLAAVATRWLLVATVVLAAPAVGALTQQQARTGGPTGLLPTMALQAAVSETVLAPVPAAATTAAHSQAPRALSAADAGLVTSLILLLGWPLLGVHVRHRRTRCVAALPPQRAPPHRLLSR